MKLLRLRADRYRSLRDQDIELGDLNLFIGANASGKSTILDALRFLSEAVRTRDFREPVWARGGLLHLAWKGEAAQQVGLTVGLRDRRKDGDRRFEWRLHLTRNGYEFRADEHVEELRPGSPPVTLLDAVGGEGWWWSGEQGRVELKQAPTACALSAAASDASFPARDVAEFVGRWGFFDPGPFLMRRDWAGLDSSRLDHYGRNLAATLHELHQSSPETLERIVEATRAIVGLPSGVELRELEDRRFHFVQTEPGLQYPVHQMGVSSGTLRTLALMTAVHAESGESLIGIEEPENYVHPTALSAFVEYLRGVQGRIQFMVTTHSPLLLDFLDAPEAVRVVRRDAGAGTTVVKQEDPDGVRRALKASGFGLGEFYETKGFGAE